MLLNDSLQDDLRSELRTQVLECLAQRRNREIVLESRLGHVCFALNTQYPLQITFFCTGNDHVAEGRTEPRPPAAGSRLQSGLSNFIAQPKTQGAAAVGSGD
jgi:hypothetical protein